MKVGVSAHAHTNACITCVCVHVCEGVRVCCGVRV